MWCRQADAAAGAIRCIGMDAAVDEGGRRRGGVRCGIDVDLPACGFAIRRDANGAAHGDLAAIHSNAAALARGAIGIHAPAQRCAALAACVDSDLPAIARRTPRHQTAGALDAPAVGAEDDAAALLGRSRRGDAAGVANRQCIHIAAVRFEFRHVRLDEAAVRHTGAAPGASGIAHDHALIACRHDEYIRACGQSHGAIRCADDTRVAHLKTDEKHIPAGGADAACIGDACRCTTRVCHLSARHEHAVAQVQRGGCEARHIHHGAPAKDDAAGIDEEHLAVGAERAVEQRRPAIQHAVQRGGGGIWHDELRLLAAGNVEGAPVNDGAVRLLVDGGQAGEGTLDLCIAQHHQTARGIGGNWSH